MSERYEIVIVGAGPAGISMAVEARFAGFSRESVLVIEKSPHHSDTIHIHYPDDKTVTANYKGFNEIHGGVLRIGDTPKDDVLKYFGGAIGENDLNVNYEESVQSIRRMESGSFEITTDKAVYLSRVCVIAIGILGKPVIPKYRLPRTMRRKIHFNNFSDSISSSDVLVVGGGDTAAEKATYLIKEQNNAYISYRGDEFFRMSDDNRALILRLESENKIKVLRGSEIIAVNRAGKKMKVDFNGKNAMSLEVDHIVYCLGGASPRKFLEDAGIEYNGEVPLLSDSFETSVPGLFLAGDLTAGKAGGSINWAFTTSHKAMIKISNEYFDSDD